MNGPRTAVHDPIDGTDRPVSTGRRVGRPRRLPGGRAVVGALLVAVSAVGVFATYLTAVGEPGTRYLVARSQVEPGTRLATPGVVAELFELQPLALDGLAAGRAVGADDLERLVGRVVVVPLAPGDLLMRTGVVDPGELPDTHTLSFPVDPAAAVAGRLRVGEEVDVLATYGSGEAARTVYVLRRMPLVAVDRPDGGGLGGRGAVVLTVGVASSEQAQALTHAVHTAELVVVRAPHAGTDDPPPPPYRPAREEPDAEIRIVPGVAPTTGEEG